MQHQSMDPLCSPFLLNIRKLSGCTALKLLSNFLLPSAVWNKAGRASPVEPCHLKSSDAYQYCSSNKAAALGQRQQMASVYSTPACTTPLGSQSVKQTHKQDQVIFRPFTLVTSVFQWWKLYHWPDWLQRNSLLSSWTCCVHPTSTSGLPDIKKKKKMHRSSFRWWKQNKSEVQGWGVWKGSLGVWKRV